MDTLLTITETAERLRVSPSMVRKLLRTDGLPHVAIGRRCLVRSGDLEIWIDGHVNIGKHHE